MFSGIWWLPGVCRAPGNFSGWIYSFHQIYIYQNGNAYDRGAREKNIGQYDSQEEVFGACAGAALYRKEMLDEIGLF